MAHNVRSNAWCITCFDLDHWMVPDQHTNFKYLVYQVEIAPTTGQWHVQGYLELHRVARLTAVTAMFSCELHIEPRVANRDQARTYCMKADTRVPGTEPLEWGTWVPSKQGQRTDLVAAATTIRDSTSWANVVNNPDLFPIMARHGKWVEQIWANRVVAAPTQEIQLRDWQQQAMSLLSGPVVKRRVLWIWSYASGTGKTTFYDYVCTKKDVLAGGSWLNTIYLYDGHPIVWFDRTRAESNSEKATDEFYSDLEKWSNGGFQISTKYVPARKLVSCHVVVTANCPPDTTRLPDRFFTIPAKTPAEEEFDRANALTLESSMDLDEDVDEKMLGS